MDTAGWDPASCGWDGFRFAVASKLAVTQQQPAPASHTSRPPVCQVAGCNADLSHLKEYHQRYRICEYHLRLSSIVRDGTHQRFCQQCGKFHLLQEFDDLKRTCRVKLQQHNERRRKARRNSKLRSKALADAKLSADSPPPAPHPAVLHPRPALAAHQQALLAASNPLGLHLPPLKVSRTTRRSSDDCDVDSCSSGTALKHNSSHSEGNPSSDNSRGAPPSTLLATPPSPADAGGPSRAALPCATSAPLKPLPAGPLDAFMLPCAPLDYDPLIELAQSLAAKTSRPSSTLPTILAALLDAQNATAAAAFPGPALHPAAFPAHRPHAAATLHDPAACAGDDAQGAIAPVAPLPTYKPPTLSPFSQPHTAAAAAAAATAAAAAAVAAAGPGPALSLFTSALSAAKAAAPPPATTAGPPTSASPTAVATPTIPSINSSNLRPAAPALPALPLVAPPLAPPLSYARFHALFPQDAPSLCAPLPDPLLNALLPSLNPAALPPALNPAGPPDPLLDTSEAMDAEFDDLITTLCLKIWNCTPWDLPLELHEDLLSVLPDALELEGCIRPGCTQLTLDAFTPRRTAPGDADAAAPAAPAAPPAPAAPQLTAAMRVAQLLKQRSPDFWARARFQVQLAGTKVESAGGPGHPRPAPGSQPPAITAMYPLCAAPGERVTLRCSNANPDTFRLFCRCSGSYVEMEEVQVEGVALQSLDGGEGEVEVMFRVPEALQERTVLRIEAEAAGGISDAMSLLVVSCGDIAREVCSIQRQEPLTPHTRALTAQIGRVLQLDSWLRTQYNSAHPQPAGSAQPAPPTRTYTPTEVQAVVAAARRLMPLCCAHGWPALFNVTTPIAAIGCVSAEQLLRVVRPLSPRRLPLLYLALSSNNPVMVDQLLLWTEQHLQPLPQADPHAPAPLPSPHLLHLLEQAGPVGHRLHRTLGTSPSSGTSISSTVSLLASLDSDLSNPTTETASTISYAPSSIISLDLEGFTSDDDPYPPYDPLAPPGPRAAPPDPDVARGGPLPQLATAGSAVAHAAAAVVGAVERWGPAGGVRELAAAMQQHRLRRVAEEEEQQLLHHQHQHQQAAAAVASATAAAAAAVAAGEGMQGAGSSDGGAMGGEASRAARALQQRRLAARQQEAEAAAAAEEEEEEEDGVMVVAAEGCDVEPVMGYLGEEAKPWKQVAMPLHALAPLPAAKAGPHQRRRVRRKSEIRTLTWYHLAATVAAISLVISLASCALNWLSHAASAITGSG